MTVSGGAVPAVEMTVTIGLVTGISTIVWVVVEGSGVTVVSSCCTVWVVVEFWNGAVVVRVKVSGGAVPPVAAVTV